MRIYSGMGSDFYSLDSLEITWGVPGTALRVIAVVLLGVVAAVMVAAFC